jgi:hypothetical protein
MKILLSIHWLLGVAIWYTISGILHDFFVIKAHKGAYDRDLLRLLMDGHVLILSGILLGFCYLMLLNKMEIAAIIAGIIGVGMLIYCAMIFPFLKSYFTMAISLMVIIVCIRICITEPNTFSLVTTHKK